MRSTHATPRFDAFAITAPGVESLAADELRELGVRGARVEQGGVTFEATRRDVYAANLHLRTASRVVVRLGAFRAEAFHELERRARKLPWAAFVSPNLPVQLRVTCRKSRLYHSDAVSERIARVIAESVPGVTLAGLDEEATQPILVRLFRDLCTVSVDSSGPLLHLRGYRQAVAKAPMRETLAAATLVASGWRGTAPLLDPLCGAGTIPIEAALLARGIPPGLERGFAFMEWPEFDESLWNELLDAARSARLPSAPASILGSDRDAGAVEAAIANAERAGVAADIEFSRRAVSAIEPPPGEGWLVTNPPYGVRVGERDRLRNLYAQLGKVARAKCPGWTIAIVAADRDLASQLRLPLRSVLDTSNGGIPISVLVAQLSETAAVENGSTMLDHETDNTR